MPRTSQGLENYGRRTTVAQCRDHFGHVQGGFLAAMLNDTMGPALAATLTKGEFAPTLNLNVSFESSAVVGTLLGRAAAIVGRVGGY